MIKTKVKPSLISGSLKVPPSKSYTHRAIILGSLSKGTTRIINPLIARDTLSSISAAKLIGASIKINENMLLINGVNKPVIPDNIIDVENSGTTIRFMTGVAGLASKGYTILTGDSSIRRRPMGPLLSSLRKLGVQCWTSKNDGRPPVIVKGGGIVGGKTTIRGDISSQFISTLLIVTPRALGDSTIEVKGVGVSRPYIEATLKMISNFNGVIKCPDPDIYFVEGNQTYEPKDFEVPGDFSSAAFIFSAAALTGGTVVVKGLDFELPQADIRILEILRELGVRVRIDRKKGIAKVEGNNEPLQGGQFDLSDSPDLLPVVSTLGLISKDWIIIKGIKHTRFKETDRIAVLSDELAKIGAELDETKNVLKIRNKGRLHRCTLNAQGDHRMFMSFCLASLVTPGGCIVLGAESLDVSYPQFIKDLRLLGAKISVSS